LQVKTPRTTEVSRGLYFKLHSLGFIVRIGSNCQAHGQEVEKKEKETKKKKEKSRIKEKNYFNSKFKKAIKMK